MKLPALTLAIRSIRVDTRGTMPYALRFGLVAIVLLCLWQVYDEMLFTGAPGLKLFYPLIVIDFIFISLLGISVFASAISEEKEDMTLGLLKMTGMSPISILLGKSIGKLLGGLMLLAAQLPFTLLTVTLGGVAPEQIAAAYWTLTSYMVLLFSVALVCSVYFRTTSSATTATLAIGLAYFIFPWLIAGIFERLVDDGSLSANGFLATSVIGVCDVLKESSAIARLVDIMELNFRGAPVGYQVGSNLVAAVALFAIAWLIFDRCTQNDSDSGPERGTLAKGASKLKRFGVGRAWSSRGTAALAWKTHYYTCGGLAMMIGRVAGLAALVMAFVVAFWWDSRGLRVDMDDLGELMMGMAPFIAIFQAAFLLGGIFLREARWQTLSGLAMLPMSTARLAYGLLLGSLPIFLPTIGMFVLGLLFSPDSFGDFLRDALDEIGFWFFVSWVLFGLHLIAYMSLFSRWAMLAVVMGGGINFGVLLLIVLMLSGSGGGEGGLGFFFLCFMFGCLVLHPLIAARLRAVAAQ